MLNDKKEVVQENSYYPFGMQINSLAYNSKSGAEQNKYLYNGKEKQSEFGLDWLDYGARIYDAEIGRWHVVDPRCEETNNVTPYGYVSNYPTIATDPDGEFLHLVVGAVVGAVAEMTSQIVSGMVQGKSFSESFGDVDWGDVGIGAAEGGLVASGVGAVAAGVGGAFAKSALDVKYKDGFSANVVGVDKSWETAGKDLVGNLAGVATGGLASKYAGDLIGDQMAKQVLNNGLDPVVGYLTTSAVTKGVEIGVDGLTNGLWENTYKTYLREGSDLRPIQLPEVEVAYDRKTKSLLPSEQKKVHDHIKEHGYKDWLRDEKKKLQ